MSSSHSQVQCPEIAAPGDHKLTDCYGPPVRPKAPILVHHHREGKVISDSCAFWSMSSGKEIGACETQTHKLTCDLVSEST